MRPKVEYNGIGSLTLTDFSVTTAVDVDDIDFYIPYRPTKHIQVFLILKDTTTGLRDVVELHNTINDGGHLVYRMPSIATLRITNASVMMSLFILEIDSGTHIESTSVRVILKTEHYQLSSQIAMISQLSADAKRYYEAIVLALKEVVMKGENNQ